MDLKSELDLEPATSAFSPLYTGGGHPVWSLSSQALWQKLCPEVNPYQRADHSRLTVCGAPSSLELLKNLPDSGLAIVGTRRAQKRAQLWIQESLSDLARAAAAPACVIISGFAHGVDQWAHASAVSSGLPTVAVLGTGLDQDYPAQSLDLRRRILDGGGLLLTEHGSSTPVRPHHFVERNRWIAALAQATWLVQAPLKSGALTTLRHAVELERDLYVSPAFLHEADFSGNLKILERASEYPRTFVHTSARSFSATWLELESALLRPQALARAPLSPLLGRITLQTHTQGGCSLERLLDWAVQAGITFPRFYADLHELVQSNQIRDHRGWLTATGAPSAKKAPLAESPPTPRGIRMEPHPAGLHDREPLDSRINS